MRNFKKFLTLVLAVMMVVSAMSFTTSAAFEDVAADNEYLADAIDLLSYMGVAKGVSETKFGTDELVTRQQFALFIYRMMKGGKDAPANGANSTNFTDLVDPTYNYAISWAYQNGIISGRTATTFDPKGAITLQEAYTMIVRALEYEADGEKLSYPFGYIEVAEKDTVNLPEGLASSVDATDALTRGDMAIILYNAFFAEVGVAEVEYVERTLSDNSVVLIEEETYPRLCEKFFDVKEVVYQAVGTPHYKVAGEENTLELGYDAILFERRVENASDWTKVPAPASAYIAAEDISVNAADLDKYFLANFTMFVTLDEDNAIEKVLYASSNMNIKTVDEIKLGTVSTNKTSSYYAGTDAKLLSGKATAGEDVFYFFNAPYSYVTPTYTTALTEAQKYVLKNEYNIGTVSIAVDDINDGTYVATVTPYAIATNYDATGVYAAEAIALASALDQVYYGGLYEADLYDVDGDGIYDYMNYKPYEFFQVNTDEDYDFYNYGVASTTNRGGYSIDEVYTTGATLSGEKFEDEDYVIGHYDQLANTIKVAAVIKPVTATIKSYNFAGKTATLNDGTKVAVDGAWKIVSNFKPQNVAYDVDDYTGFTEYDNLLAAANIDDDKIDLYIYDGVVLYEEGAKSAALTFSENLIIPTTDKDGNNFEPQFNTTLGKKIYYIYAWVDGDLKWVPVETEDVYPEIVNNGAYNTADYLDQLCTYSVDADGIYTITSLENAKDEDGNNIGINWEKNQAGNWVATNDVTVLGDDEDGELQYMYTGLSGYLKKIVGTRFELQDAQGANQLAFRLNLTDDTRIVIKNTKFQGTADEEIEYIEYTAETLTTSSDVIINNVAVIVLNDVDYTNREDALVIYGEAVDFDLKGAASTTGYRIVKDSDPYVDENGYYRNGYTVLNPFTGKTETIAGNKTASTAGTLATAVATGKMVDLKDGKINDATGAVIDTFNGVANAMHTIDNADAQAGLVWILEYDAKDNMIVVADVVDGTDWYSITETGSFTVDNNTVVTLLKHEKAGDLVKWGNFSLLTTADLGSAKNELKCYNEKVPTYKQDGSIDTAKPYKTGYAKYLKAYIVTENEQNLEDGELNKVTFVTIVANGYENEAHLTTNKRP